MQAVDMIRFVEQRTREGRADVIQRSKDQQLGKCQCPMQWLAEIQLLTMQAVADVNENARIRQEYNKAYEVLGNVSQAMFDSGEFIGVHLEVRARYAWTDVAVPRALRLQILAKAIARLEAEITQQPA